MRLGGWMDGWMDVDADVDGWMVGWMDMQCCNEICLNYR